jgi:hypothetical protein
MPVVRRAAIAAVGALVVGLVLSYLLAGALRSAVPGEQLLSRVAPTPKLAVWALVAAHGVPIRVTAGAEVESDRLERIGELFGRSELGAGASMVVVLPPMTLLAIAGLIVIGALRRSGAGPPDVVPAVLTSALVYGAGLAALALTAGSWTGVDGRIVRFGVGASVPAGYAFVAGAAWAGAFAALGIAANARVRASMTPLVRGLWAGFTRASLVASVTSVAALIVLAVAQTGEAGGVSVSGRLGAIGIALFAVNVVAAGVVLSHGVPMRAAFAAGPLSGFTTLGYATSGEASLSPVRYIFVLVPLLSLVVAGRAMRKHVPRADAMRAAAAFGAVWGILLALLAVMLRVRVLSTFEISALRAGGGTAVNAIVAFVLGSVIAAVLAYIGQITASRREPAQATPAATDRPRTCEACGSEVPLLDAFCANCGRPAGRT